MSSVDSEPADPVVRALEERARESVRVERVLDHHRGGLDYRHVQPADVVAALDAAPDGIAVAIHGHTGLTHIRREQGDHRRPYRVWSHSFIRERTSGHAARHLDEAAGRDVRRLVDGRRVHVLPLEASVFRRDVDELVDVHRKRVAAWEARE